MFPGRSPPPVLGRIQLRGPPGLPAGSPSSARFDLAPRGLAVSSLVQGSSGITAIMASSARVSFLFQSRRSPAASLDAASPAGREELPQGSCPEPAHQLTSSSISVEGHHLSVSVQSELLHESRLSVDDLGARPSLAVAQQVPSVQTEKRRPPPETI